jgi:hypothetical protein
METAHKNRMLFWLLIFLIIVNLSALATYYFSPVKLLRQGCCNDSASPDCILHSQLKLTKDQNGLVDSINAKYQTISRPISGQIKELRAVILDELETPDPDSAFINRLTEEIAALQLQLHRENIIHYLELKKVCDPDQALRLSNLYREIYGCPMHQAGGKHQQHRFRNR